MDQFTTVDQIEKEALKRLTQNALSYYSNGANNMVSLRDGTAAFAELKLKPAAEVDETLFEGTDTTFLGEQIRTPISIASTAFHKMAHPDGEIATARAANNFLQTPLLLSNWATSTIEEVSQNAPDAMKMYQIYMSKSETVNDDMWKRCRENGYKAMCLTSDTQLLGKRDQDVRVKFELPKHLDLANLAPYSSSGESSAITSTTQSALAEYVANHKNNDIDWSIIPYVKRVSQLPVFAKGIMCYEDALLALENGADGLFVSNHGARQLDTTPATIQILPSIMSAEVPKISQK